MLLEALHEEFLVAVGVGESPHLWRRMVVSLFHTPYEIIARSGVLLFGFISSVIPGAILMS